jgi:hypothetical protein
MRSATSSSRGESTSSPIEEATRSKKRFIEIDGRPQTEDRKTG